MSQLPISKVLPGSRIILCSGNFSCNMIGKTSMVLPEV